MAAPDATPLLVAHRVKLNSMPRTVLDRSEVSVPVSCSSQWRLSPERMTDLPSYSITAHSTASTENGQRLLHKTAFHRCHLHSTNMPLSFAGKLQCRLTTSSVIRRCFEMLNWTEKKLERIRGFFLRECAIQIHIWLWRLTSELFVSRYCGCLVCLFADCERLRTPIFTLPIIYAIVCGGWII